MHAVTIILLLISICSNAKTLDSTIERWKSVWKITMSDFIRPHQAIDQPVGGVIVIGELWLYQADFSITKDCLYLKVPGKNIFGKLSTLNIKAHESCDAFILDEKAKILLEKFYNIAFSWRNDQFKVFYDRKQTDFYFPNLDKRYKHVKISTLTTIEHLTSPNLGICFDVDDECNILKNECHLCQTVITPAIASQCSSMTRKYCGAIQCGEKDQIACLRGFRASGYTGPYCINDSPLGYCQEPYRVMCIDGELICR